MPMHPDGGVSYYDACRLAGVEPMTGVLKFDPNQPRDPDGKWTDGSGGRAAHSEESHQAWLDGLTTDERKAFNEWTSGSYREYRDLDKYGGAKTGLYGAFHAALEKSPRWAGTVHRGIHDLSPETMAKFVEGAEFTWDATSSSSTKPHIGEHFAMKDLGDKERNRRGRIVMELEVATGTNIAGTLDKKTNIFADGLEAEVILHKGTKYRIVSAEDRELPEPKGGWDNPENDDEYVPPWRRKFRHVRLKEI